MQTKSDIKVTWMLCIRLKHHFIIKVLLHQCQWGVLSVHLKALQLYTCNSFTNRRRLHTKESKTDELCAGWHWMCSHDVSFGFQSLINEEMRSLLQLVLLWNKYMRKFCKFVLDWSVKRPNWFVLHCLTTLLTHQHQKTSRAGTSQAGVALKRNSG